MIRADILTTRSLELKSDFFEILNVLKEHSADLVTGRWGTVEPLEHSLSPDKLKEVVAVKNPPLIWRSSKRQVEGSIWPGASDRHGTVTIRAGGRNLASLLVELTTELSQFLDADFAFLHLTSEAEKSDDERRHLWTTLHAGVSTHSLREGLPAPACLTIFGKPYIELLGRDKLLSIPIGKVRELSRRQVVLELIDVRNQAKMDYNWLVDAREQVMGFVGNDNFAGAEPVDRKFVPDFGLDVNPKIARSRELWRSLVQGQPAD